MKLALVVTFAVVLLTDQSHALYYKTRSYYSGDEPFRQPRTYATPATVVVLLPTMSEECDSDSCSRVVRSIQRNDMSERNFNDLAENFVVGGCTGIFPGSGWEGISPLSEIISDPSVHIAAVGTFNDHRVPSHIAKTIKDLIRDGVNRGKIDPDFKIKFSNMNGPCPVKFMETMKGLMRENFDLDASIYAD